MCKRLIALVCATAVSVTSFTVLRSTEAKAAVNGDGTIEVNENYFNHISLQPVPNAFQVDTILKWTPENDPDARYNRAIYPLRKRFRGPLINPLASENAKITSCAITNSNHDTAPTQGGDVFSNYAFGYWQYIDTYIYWAGTEEGIFAIPSPDIVDAAHKNGVPVVATVGFPWGSGSSENVNEVVKFCQKAEDGTFPVADKMVQVAKYYGFDGYFLNQETYGCDSQTAKNMADMMKYVHRKYPDFIFSWYDSMSNRGNVSYQNAVNSYNDSFMKPDSDGVYAVNDFFMNYGWYGGEVDETVSTMKSLNRNQFDAFAGIDVQQNGINTPFRDHLLLDENGKLKLSIALYCPNSTMGTAKDPADFHNKELDFYVGPTGDPSTSIADGMSTGDPNWLGISRFVADKSVINKIPFVTNFNTGHGKKWYIDGEVSRDREWNNRSMQDILPTWTWIIKSEGSKLKAAYDFDTAYYGGNSIKFYGRLEANNANDVRLFSTDLKINGNTKINLNHMLNNTDSNLKVGLCFGDNYEDKNFIYLDLATGDANKWINSSLDLSKYADKTLKAISIKAESTKTIEDFKANVGEIAIVDGSSPKVAAPSSVTLDEIQYNTANDAEARVYWNKSLGAEFYEVYKVKADGKKEFLGATPNTAYFISKVQKESDKKDVTLQVVPVNKEGIRGEGKNLVINWQLPENASENVVESNSINICLGAKITGVSNENKSEPAAKAIDGTSADGSKWCATNRSTGYMSIDVGAPKTVRRWRVEHAEYGGEANNMNTIDFSLEYKDVLGNWQEAKRITNNDKAVTDVILDKPITAQEFKLRVYNDGSSPWGGIRIYEWQMFEDATLPKTPYVPMQFASATNNVGAQDTFTLKNVSKGSTVRLYSSLDSSTAIVTKSVSEGNEIEFSNLDFGKESGRIYYTTETLGLTESYKMSTAYEAEDAEITPEAKNVEFKKYSAVNSTSSSYEDNIFVQVKVNDLKPGDVVYVYEKVANNPVSKVSLPVKAGETSVSLDRILVAREGGKVDLQVKSEGMLISGMYTMDAPKFDAPKGIIRLHAFNEDGEGLNGVSYNIYDESGVNLISEVGSVSDSGGTIELPLGSYVMKCEKVPSVYEKDMTEYNITLKNESEEKFQKVILKYALADKEELKELYNQNKDKVKEEYTNESWDNFSKALEELKGVIDNENALQKEADEVKESLNQAVNNLVKLGDKKELLALYDVNKDKKEEEYSTSTWKVFSDVMNKVKVVLDNTQATEEEVTKALADLNKAISGLVKRGDKTGLAKLYEDSKTKVEKDYTSESWKQFTETMKKVEAVIENKDASSDEVTKAFEDLKQAIDKLVNLGDKTELVKVYEENKSKSSKDYTSASWKQFDDAMKNAKAVIENNQATTEDVNNALKALESTLNNLAKREDNSALVKLYEENTSKNEKEYTSSTWKVFSKACEEAKVVMDNVDATKEQITNAMDNLMNAVKGLTKVGDKTELNKLYNANKELDKNMYTYGSYGNFAKALENAKGVLNNRNALQEDINKAKDELSAAVASLVKNEVDNKVDNSKNEEAVKDKNIKDSNVNGASNDNTVNNTTNNTKLVKTGSYMTIYSILGVSVVLLGLGVYLLSNKKKVNE